MFFLSLLNIYPIKNIIAKPKIPLIIEMKVIPVPLELILSWYANRFPDLIKTTLLSELKAIG
jgi:hypothetical protein